jgi:hypothetical protein
VSNSKSNILRLISHILAGLFNSRSAFHAQWRRYQPRAVGPKTIAGRWTGEWISEITGHRGELRCVLVPGSSGCTAYFYAKFSKLFRVGYVTTLIVQEVDGRTLLKGEEDLGALAGGIYRSEGEITSTEFNCAYSCKYDRGMFRLKRLD